MEISKVFYFGEDMRIRELEEEEKEEDRPAEALCSPAKTSPAVRGGLGASLFCKQ